MADKKKEIKIEWAYGSSDLIEGHFFFVNDKDDKTFMLTLCGGPDEKVLKAKARIKESAPEHIALILAERPGFKQVDRDTYEKAYTKQHNKVAK